MKYWDPQASSVKKFVDLGLGTAEQYTFSALSNKLLGQAQDYQFQSPDKTGTWQWGSKCTPIYDENDNEKIIDTVCGSSTLQQNELNAVPRSYHNGNNAIGDYYNWYSATAESGRFDTPINASPSDSVCPKGWKLPRAGTINDDKSWRGMLVGTYGFDGGAKSSEDSRHNTLSLGFFGYYRSAGGIADVNSIGYFISSMSGNRGFNYTMVALVSNNELADRYDWLAKTSGPGLRCVKE